MKMDLRQGYNNVRIKKGNEWKAAFSMLESAYKCQEYSMKYIYSTSVKAKLDIVHFQHNQFSGWSVPNNKPTVIFFELTNSLVTFQTIINDLLRNSIEVEDIY